MLAKGARISNSADFARVTKSGIRSSTKSLIGYLYISNINTPARCGLIINKSVGNSVMRHRVARKIRHSLYSNLNHLPNGSLFVVRALPTSTTADIQMDTNELIKKLLNKVTEKSLVH
jgi:ribonuclease P protein component